jgi:hypothetical protein
MAGIGALVKGIGQSYQQSASEVEEELLRDSSAPCRADEWEKRW